MLNPLLQDSIPIRRVYLHIAFSLTEQDSLLSIVLKSICVLDLVLLVIYSEIDSLRGDSDSRESQMRAPARRRERTKELDSIEVEVHGPIVFTN